MDLNRNLVAFFVLVSASILALIGCGGSDNAVAPITPGTASIRITWPARSRAPLTALSSALSAKITIPAGSGGGSDAIFQVNRDPSKVASYTSSYPVPTEGTLVGRNLSVSFYAQADATGDVVGGAVATLVASPNGADMANIVLEGKVASVEVPDTVFALNAPSRQLTFAAKSVSGQTIAVSVGSAFWQKVSGSSILLSNSGLATPRVAGTSVVRATVDGITSPNATIRIAEAAPSFLPPGYVLAWSDEFSGATGSTPDSSTWNYDLGGGGWGNGEQQIYTNTNATIQPDAVGTDGSVLDIASSTDGVNYYSSRIKTQGLRQFQYGYIECRAKVPPGGTQYQGYWPAFWTLGTDISTVGWPTCGEIDVMEHLCGTQPGTIYSTIHSNLSGGSTHWSFGQTVSGVADYGQGYHTYGVLWSQNSIRYYVDGVAIGPAITPATAPSGAQWQFNKPHFLILNMAIGGGWPGNPTSSTLFPAHYLVDYVRVYQKL